MGSVTVTKTVNDISECYHFEEYEDFIKWESKSDAQVNAEETDEDDGWIANPGYQPVEDSVNIKVKINSAEISTQTVAGKCYWGRGSELTHYKIVN